MSSLAYSDVKNIAGLLFLLQLQHGLRYLHATRKVSEQKPSAYPLFIYIVFLWPECQYKLSYGYLFYGFANYFTVYNIFWDHKDTYPYKNSFEDERKGHMILNYLAKNCNV